MAFLRFEDLTGDASLAWIANAAPGILTRELSGGAHALALSANTVRDAYLARATRLVHGYYEMRAGKLHYQIEVEDPAEHKMIQSLAVDGDVLSAMNSAARSLGKNVEVFATSNSDAIAAWATSDYEKAVTIDPDFGPAWLAWVGQLASSGNAAEALAKSGEALARTSLRTPADRVQIQILSATLQGDKNARLARLRELTRLIPADPTVQHALADLDMEERHFGEGASAYKAASQADPADANLVNMLGYAEALSGNVEEARKTFEQYGKMPEQSENALDSLGEGLFLNGKFQDAEKAFLEAYAKNPNFLSGETAWKAAHARWLGGDLAGADMLAKRYFDQRTKQRDPLVVWHRANWMYETGRKDQALKTLNEAPAESTELARKQAAVWNDPQSMPRDISELKQAYERTAPAQDGLVRTFYAAALLRAGQKEEARKLIELWPLPNFDDARQALMYPTFLELRKQLK